MATAAEDTIPCEHCDTQIDLQEWPSHEEKCVANKNRISRKRERNDTEEPITEGIPCEYCHVQISLDDWESHSNQCADLHKSRVEKLRSGVSDDEPTIIQIPCEYCSQPIDMHDLERHSRQCMNNNKTGVDATIELNMYGSVETNIPCEYCGRQVSIHDYTWHTTQCADAEKKRIEDITSRNQKDPNNTLIPCEYCQKPFALQLIQDHETECRRLRYASQYQSNGAADLVLGGIASFPETWTWNDAALNNFSVHTLEVETTEYEDVKKRFHETLPSNQIVKIERIQNRRWYRQYVAHRDDFIERYNKSTEQWLFHGCKSDSTKAIMNECFNRSRAVRCAAGQGIYFAAQASTSLAYTQPDASNLRYMFMARVLVGKTAPGDQSTRVCPAGYDTTGGGGVFVTYHDAQAYGEYLITFR